MSTVKRALRPRIYWLLMATTPRGEVGSDSLIGSETEARRRARQMAEHCQAPVEGFRGGGTARSFEVWP